jgi:aryl carrier-like protein
LFTDAEKTGGGCFYHDDFPATELRQGLTFSSVGRPIETVKMRLTNTSGHTTDQSEIGVLEVSGPAVFNGYASNEKATREVFSGSWFSTGDKGYLDDTGRIILRGREKDTIIVNGTNFFSHELESTVRVADIPGVEPTHIVVIPTWNAAKGTEEVVVLFQPTTDAYEQRKLLSSAVRKIASATAKLCSQYPREIIPLPFRFFHKTSLGKILRQRLKVQYDEGQFEIFQLEESANENGIVVQEIKTEEVNPFLGKLRQVWSEVLGKPEALVRSTDNFFNLGGDSIRMIQLVSELQAQKISLDARDIFEYPNLSSMATRCQPFEQKGVQFDRTIELTKDMNHIQDLDIPGENIQSVSRCSPVQEGLVASSINNKKGQNIVHLTYIVKSEDFQFWRAAWIAIIQHHPLLRTRFYSSPECLLQVVTKAEEPRFSEFSNLLKLEQYLESLELTLGARTVWFSIQQSGNTEEFTFVWSSHHAVIDAWSAKLILDDLSIILNGGTLPTSSNHTSFDQFVDYTRSVSRESAEQFWRHRLREVAVPRTTLYKGSQVSRRKGALDTFHMDKPIDISALRGSSLTVSSILKGALALTLAHHMGSTEVCFGSTTSGRMAPVGGIHSMAAPAMATIPTIVNIDMNMSCISWLKEIQKSSLEALAYEQIGLHQIAKVSDTAQYLCDFPCVLDVQPSAAKITRLQGKGIDARLVASQTRTEYPLVIIANFDEEQLYIDATFYQNLFEPDELALMISHLREAVTSMLRVVVDPQKDVKSIDIIGPADKSYLQNLKRREAKTSEMQ